MNTIIEKIRAEVERRMNGNPHYVTYKELESILSVLSDLEKSEKPIEGLEEVADDWYKQCPFPKSTWWDDGKEMKLTDSKETFIAGARWQREQMMKEAVEGRVVDAGLFATYYTPVEYTHSGDKVKIIIVKED